MLGFTFDLYIQAFPGRLIVRPPESSLSEEVNGLGFDHPRMPVGNFGAADAALKGAVRLLAPSRLHSLGRILFHVQHEWEGGLTEVDLRALKDLAVSAGARSVNVYAVPANLSESDIHRLLRAKRGSEPGLT